MRKAPIMTAATLLVAAAALAIPSSVRADDLARSQTCCSAHCIEGDCTACRDGYCTCGCTNGRPYCCPSSA
jgi:hypothetical protein